MQFVDILLIFRKRYLKCLLDKLINFFSVCFCRVYYTFQFCFLSFECRDVFRMFFIDGIYIGERIQFDIGIFKGIVRFLQNRFDGFMVCLLYTSPSPRDRG